MFDLKKIRENKNLSQEELAEKVLITRQSISAYERGLATPSPEVAKAIANILQFNWTEFFD